MTNTDRQAARVLHTVPALFGADGGMVGGAERYVLELARHMASRVETELVTFGPVAREERVGDLRIHVIGEPWHVKGQQTNPFALSLLRWVRRADVVHCHQQHIVASTASAITARLLGKRVFCTDLGGGGWDLSGFVSTDRLFSGHLHISEYSRNVFGHADLSLAHVILGGVDAGKFSAGTEARTGGVLFVGRILPHKGVDVLIRAVPESLPLTIVGPALDARYFADLQQLAHGKKVTFRHDVADTELVDLYRRAMCIVLPSVYDDMYGGHTDVPELLGQTLLEGMACGAPAICSAVASMPEIVDDGVTGFVVPPNDPQALRQALESIATSPEKGRAFGQAARSSIERRFTWDAVVDRCLAAYEGAPVAA